MREELEKIASPFVYGAGTGAAIGSSLGLLHALGSSYARPEGERSWKDYPIPILAGGSIGAGVGGLHGALSDWAFQKAFSKIPRGVPK
jgi:hypothetical protein